MLVVVILFIGILGLLAYLDTRKPKNFPPGPKWQPFFGCALELAKMKKKIGHFLMVSTELSKKHGPVIGLKIGKEKFVVVYDPHAFKEFLMSDDLAGRPIGDFFELRTWGKRRGIILTDEKLWQEQRKFIIRQLREFGFGRRDMSALVEAETQELINSICENIKLNDSTVVNVLDMFPLHVLNTIWSMLAGARYGKEDPKMMELQHILGDIFRAFSMVGAPFSHFPILKYLAPELSGYNVYIRNHMRIWNFLKLELDYHKATHKPTQPRDFMDVYLNVLNSYEDTPDTFDEKQLAALCMDMFMAGSETTSNTLSFGFLYLILCPDVQKKAQQEIDEVVGKHRCPMLSDRPNLPYVECVALEAMRMFSGRAFTVPHRALRDTNLCGYRIPKDVLVIGNMNGCLMSPISGFDEPEKFKPERFLKDGKVTVPDNFLPFGLGKHRCMGESLARANVFLFTAALLQKFTFTALSDSPPTEEWVDGITPTPKPFKAKVIPRI